MKLFKWIALRWKQLFCGHDRALVPITAYHKSSDGNIFKVDCMDCKKQLNWRGDFIKENYEKVKR